jgi:hypothetical protein
MKCAATKPQPAVMTRQEFLESFDDLCRAFSAYADDLEWCASRHKQFSGPAPLQQPAWRLTA